MKFTIRLLYFIITVFYLTVLHFVSPAFAQEYTNFADICKIVQESGHFDVHMTDFDKEIETEKILKEQKHLNDNLILIPSHSGQGNPTISEYKIPSKLHIIIEKAKGDFRKGDFDSAIKSLVNGKEIDYDCFPLGILLGKIYYEKGNYKDAIKILDEVLKKNPISSMAYKLKGDCLVKIGEFDTALDCYIMALIYNRNSPEVWQALEALGRQMGFELYRQPFVPMYSLQKLSTGKVRIYFDSNEKLRWMPYSFCKAVWQYEPGYFQKRTGQKEYEPTLLEEMECVNSMIWAYGAFIRSGNFDRDPMLERLRRIQYRNFLREFVLFEIISPKKPEVLITLDAKYIQDMIDYVKEFVVVRKRVGEDYRIRE